jgi:RNA methyltransferase, TrmH family
VEEITSPQNPLIKLVRSLDHRKHREKRGLFVAEGLDYARKAMAHGFEPHLLLTNAETAAYHTIPDLIDWCLKQRARVLTISAVLMQRISGLNNPQDLLLVCHTKWQRDPAAFHARRTVLALHGIRDPGNLGTIMRTAEAAGVSRILLIDDCCDPYGPEAVRASAGSVFAVEITRIASDAFLDLAAGWAGDVVGTHLAATESFRQPYRRPVLLLMGSESSGLSPELARACSKLVHIPMAKGVESLNVATATALMLYELELPDL